MVRGMANELVHIHFVEDEEEMQILFTFNFRKEIKNKIFKITFSNNGQECLDYFQTEESGDIKLVLSDINMPVMDGLSLLEELKKIRVDLPVFMVSAYETGEYINVAKKLGADYFISKPVNFKKLRELIYRELNIEIK